MVDGQNCLNTLALSQVMRQHKQTIQQQVLAVLILLWVKVLGEVIK